MKPPLKLAVQLFKRWRDLAFEGREKLAPSSIVLTTMSGTLYRGEPHPTEALLTILDGIYHRSLQEPIVLYNPSNPKECITDRWRENPEAYAAFLEAVYDFRIAMHKLLDAGRYPSMIDALKELFGDVPVARAFTKFAERRKAARNNGSLIMERATGNLSVSPAVAPAFIKGKEHTFYGVHED